MEWWDPSSRFIAYDFVRSQIFQKIGRLMQRVIWLLSLEYREHKKKKRVELWHSDLHGRELEAFCVVKLSNRVCCFLSLCRQLWLDHHLDVLQAPQFKEILLGAIKDCESDSVNPIPAEVWQRTESVPGMPALMAEGQTLISDARHVSSPISIKPRLWLAQTMHNSRFYQAYAAFSAIHLSLQSGP